MDRAEKYRADAARALSDSESAKRAEDRSLFLEIAQRWLELAQLDQKRQRPPQNRQAQKKRARFRQAACLRLLAIAPPAPKETVAPSALLD